MRDLPTGTVTFLFTDIEGSTKLLRRLGDRYGDVIADHGRILREAIAHGEGTEVGTEGDAFFAVFTSPTGAIAAAVHAQRGLAAHRWPDGHPVPVRMGMHTGRAVLVGDDYMGLDIHVAARIAAAAHGGQVLVSEVTHPLVERALPRGVSMRDLGRHRLKDIEQPLHLWDVVIDGLPGEFPAIRTLDARPTNLPPQRTSFVGRDQEVAEITELLARSRLVTLTGPGGTGKTRLALKVAADHLDRFSDGVFLADLSPITDPGLVPSVIAGALLVREEPERDLLETLAEHLRDRRALLVLDNSEQVIESGVAVARLLDAAPQLTVLATSRMPFHVSGEREYRVPPLAVPDPEQTPDVDDLARQEAIALFTERAAAVQPGFRITTENAQAVAAIIRRLDGLPLAIELAASRLNVLSPQALLDRLGRRFAILSTGPLDIPARHRTLRATIEWSHDMLSAEEQRLFSRLGVFRGGWTLEAAEVICGSELTTEVLDGLDALVHHSLVQRLDAPDQEVRFTMLESIREFALERLADGPDEHDVRNRLLRWVRELAEEAVSRLKGEDQLRWLDRLDREHDNIRTALEWAGGGGPITDGLKAATALWRFWQERSHLSEARDRLERLLSAPGAQARDALRAQALGALGSIAYWQNDLDRTRAAYQEAVEIARDAGDPDALASALYNASFIPSLAGDFDAAEALLKEAVETAKGADDPSLTAGIWSALG
ncbi:MAG: adenylate/guanylate cyclase domain-containing protein, partial [Actinomycetota bacterium]